MTEYTKVPAWDLGPGKDLARRFRDAEGLFFACLIGAIVTVVGGTFALVGVIQEPGTAEVVAGWVGLAALAVYWLAVAWLVRARGFYVEVEGDRYGYSGSPAGALRDVWSIWRKLPPRERFEMRPVIEAAYKAARVGGDKAVAAIDHRKSLLRAVLAEVERRETMRRRAIIGPQDDDLAVGQYVLRDLSEANDAEHEGNEELRKAYEELVRAPVEEDT